MLKELREQLLAGEFENSDELLRALDQMTHAQKQVVLLAYQLGEDAGFEQASEDSDKNV